MRLRTVYTSSGLHHFAGGALGFVHTRAPGALPYSPLPTDEMAAPEPTGGTWLCKVEEMRAQGAQQVGQSACGPTAILNVLRAAGLKKLPTVEAVLRTTPARQRDYDTRSLHAYLLSRVKAGTTHADLIDGVAKLSGGEVQGRLFVVDAHASPEALSDWLAGWMAGGGVPMLTLNLFLDGQDAFHHQVRHPSLGSPPSHRPGAHARSSPGLPPPQTVFGVEKGGDVWASNPVMKYKPEHLLSLLTGGGHMIIPKEHILWRFQEAFKDGTAQVSLGLAAKTSTGTCPRIPRVAVGT